MKIKLLTLCLLGLVAFSPVVASETDDPWGTREWISLAPSCLLGLGFTVGSGALETIPVLAIVPFIMAGNNNHPSVLNQLLFGAPLGLVASVVEDVVVMTIDWGLDGRIDDGHHWRDGLYERPFAITSGYLPQIYLGTRGVGRHILYDSDNTCAKAIRSVDDYLEGGDCRSVEGVGPDGRPLPLVVCDDSDQLAH